MLFDKPTGKITGRITFYGITPQGRKVWGNFARLKGRSLQIKVNSFWRTVNKIYTKDVKNAQQG